MPWRVSAGESFNEAQKVIAEAMAESFSQIAHDAVMEVYPLGLDDE